MSRRISLRSFFASGVRRKGRFPLTCIGLSALFDHLPQLIKYFVAGEKFAAFGLFGALRQFGFEFKKCFSALLFMTL